MAWPVPCCEALVAVTAGQTRRSRDGRRRREASGVRAAKVEGPD